MKSQHLFTITGIFFVLALMYKPFILGFWISLILGLIRLSKEKREEKNNDTNTTTTN